MVNMVAIEELGFQCCFCENGIKADCINPCLIIGFVDIHEPINSQPSQDLFCHFLCIQKRLVLTQSVSAHYDEQTKYDCCFCGKNIVPNKFDQCRVEICMNV